MEGDHACGAGVILVAGGFEAGAVASLPSQEMQHAHHAGWPLGHAIVHLGMRLCQVPHASRGFRACITAICLCSCTLKQYNTTPMVV